MELIQVPLDHLSISPLNMRHGRKAPPVDDILPSIRKRGILQPLLVRPNGEPDRYEIFAGRRRYFAAKTVGAETDTVPDLPCLLLGETDDADAVEASLLENTARLAPDEMAQYAAFKRLADQGRGVDEIAEAFGVTELTVKRRLALANLLPAIRTAYSKEEIDARTVTALTLATRAQQREWLALFRAEDGYAPRGAQLKAWLCGGASVTTDKAIFDLEDYSGAILADLFGEHGVFADADLFWSHQNAAIAALAEGFIDKGWTDCVVLDRGAHFLRWDHVAASKAEGGKVFIEVRETGEVTIHKGFVTRREHGRRTRTAAGAAPSTDAAERPELSKAAQNYFELHRHALVRAALLARPEIALRLAAAHMIAGSPLWRVEPEPQRADKAATAESVAVSPAQTAFEAERAGVLALLDLPEDRASLCGAQGDDWSLASLFARLLTLSDAEVSRIVAFAMAETLAAGASVVDVLGAHLGVDACGQWAPDEAFFDLMRDKRTVNAMLREIGGKTVADANVSETAKTQKRIIRDFLTGEGRKKTADWLPRYLQFPLRAYTKAGAGRLSETARRAKQIVA